MQRRQCKQAIVSSFRMFPWCRYVRRLSEVPQTVLELIRKTTGRQTGRLPYL